MKTIFFTVLFFLLMLFSGSIIFSGADIFLQSAPDGKVTFPDGTVTSVEEAKELLLDQYQEFLDDGQLKLVTVPSGNSYSYYDFLIGIVCIFLGGGYFYWCWMKRKEISKTMNKTFDTFFFGYLALKWRRLFRIFIVLPYVFLEIILFFDALFFAGFCFGFAIPVAVGLLSWLTKPFIVEE